MTPILSRRAVVGVAFACLVSATSAPTPAMAEQAWDLGSGEVSIDLEAGAGAFFADGIARNNGLSGDDHTWWVEGYIEPGINGTFDLGAAGTLSGRISAVGTITRGDGDPGGNTVGHEEDLELEHAFVRYCSGPLDEDGECEGTFELSGGRQDFHIGDGFLIWDGNLDQFGKGAYWLAPRSAFEAAGVVSVSVDGVRADGFYLNGDQDQDDTELVGINIDYELGDIGTLGGTYLHVLDSDPFFFDQRAGMNVVSVRANGIDLSTILPGLSAHGEYVREFGDGENGAVDAHAWYAELAYTFEDVPWSPTIAYRYAVFSGEENDGDGTSEAFDPLFYEGDVDGRGWGTWVQGEIVGNYFLFNSNQVNHMVHVSAYPSDEIGVGAIYYDFDLEEANYFSTPVGDKDFAQEVNFYADWEIVPETLYLSALYGFALPDDAAQELFGNDDAMHILEAAAFLYF